MYLNTSSIKNKKMIITRTQDTMTIRSIEQVKLFMSILFMSLGILSLISPFLFRDVSAWASLIGIMVLLPVTIMLLEVTYTRIELHKIGPSKVTVKNLRHEDNFEFTISDMKSVIKEEYVGFLGNGSNEPNDLLILTFKNRENLELASTRGAVSWPRSFRPYRKEAKQIAEFAGVQVEVKEIDILQDIKSVIENTIPEKMPDDKSDGVTDIKNL